MPVYNLPYTGGVISLDSNLTVKDAMRILRDYPIGKLNHLFNSDDIAYIDASVRLVSLLYCYQRKLPYSTGHGITALVDTISEARKNMHKLYPLARLGKDYLRLSLASQIIFTAHLLKRSDKGYLSKAVALPLPDDKYYTLCQSLGIPSKSIAVEAYELFRDNLIHESGMRPYAARHDGSNRYRNIHKEAEYNETLDAVLARSGFIGESASSIGMINSPEVPHIATSTGLVQITHSQLIIQTAMLWKLTPDVSEQAAFFALRYFLSNKDKLDRSVSTYERKVTAQDTIMQRGAGLGKRIGSAPPLSESQTVRQNDQKSSEKHHATTRVQTSTDASSIEKSDPLRNRIWF